MSLLCDFKLFSRSITLSTRYLLQCSRLYHISFGFQGSERHWSNLKCQVFRALNRQPILVFKSQIFYCAGSHTYNGKSDRLDFIAAFRTVVLNESLRNTQMAIPFAMIIIYWNRNNCRSFNGGYNCTSSFLCLPGTVSSDDHLGFLFEQIEAFFKHNISEDDQKNYP
jgi:hypothetical protein